MIKLFTDLNSYYEVIQERSSAWRKTKNKSSMIFGINVLRSVVLVDELPLCPSFIGYTAYSDDML